VWARGGATGQILTALVRACRVPVTCKIRLLDTVEATVAFAKAAEAAGVAAVAVHARHVTERPRDAPHYEYVRAVSAALRIPVIANGGSLEIRTRADLEHVRQQCGSVPSAAGPPHSTPTHTHTLMHMARVSARGGVHHGRARSAVEPIRLPAGRAAAPR
jgi:tRNA-dihydrouridine synthase